MYYRIITFGLILLVMTGCSADTAIVSTETPPPLASELTLYDWPEDMPQSVLDAFTEETGVKINYVTYESEEEAFINVEAGEVYDVVVFENNGISMLISQGFLAEINYDHIPNFAHIAPNFKNLAYDPDNMHSIPYNWGTTGLLVRSDLVAEMPSHWADLWDPQYAGKVAIRNGMPYDLIGLTLKSLGYPLNSEDPAVLADVEEHLLKLRPHVIFTGSYAEAAVPLLLSGEAVIMMGWAEDVLAGQAENEDIVYLIPAEGTMLWGDSFAIPANSPHQYTAEIFLNFLLRPEISAQITNENYYATPNEAARPYIDSEIRNNPIIFPSDEDLKNAEIYLPLSMAGEQRYLEIWEHFLAAP